MAEQVKKKQYVRLSEKVTSSGGTTHVSQNDLMRHYQSYNGSLEVPFRRQLGNGMNRALSFDQYKEAETTKHIRRFYPYKGKFIP